MEFITVGVTCMAKLDNRCQSRYGLSPCPDSGAAYTKLPPPDIINIHVPPGLFLYLFPFMENWPYKLSNCVIINKCIIFVVLLDIIGLFINYDSDI